MRWVKSVELVSLATIGLKLLGSPRVARTILPPYLPTTGLYWSLVKYGWPTWGTLKAGPAGCACPREKVEVARKIRQRAAKSRVSFFIRIPFRIFRYSLL